MYVTWPISKVIGFGQVIENYLGKSLVWPDEEIASKVIYPFGWGFELIHCLPEDRWQSEGIPIRDPRLVFFRGVNPCWNADAVNILINKVASKWNLENICD